jgi:hypothetical protein
MIQSRGRARYYNNRRYGRNYYDDYYGDYDNLDYNDYYDYDLRRFNTYDRPYDGPGGNPYVRFDCSVFNSQLEQCTGQLELTFFMIMFHLYQQYSQSKYVVSFFVHRFLALSFTR